MMDTAKPTKTKKGATLAFGDVLVDYRGEEFAVLEVEAGAPGQVDVTTVGDLGEAIHPFGIYADVTVLA